MDDKQTKRTAKAYNRLAKKYDEKWKGYLTHTHRKMLSVFTSGEDHTILDVSAGTGLFAHHLLADDYPYSELVLNDISGKMLKVARQRLKDREDVFFTEFPAEELEFEDETFESVVSMSAFHNYADQAMSLSEIYRVLKPGGKFYLLDWNRKGLFRLVSFYIDKTTDEVIQTRSADEVRKMLGDASFQINTSEEWKYLYWNFFLTVAQK